VTGSTALGKSTDPEALRALLARRFERRKGIVESHCGTVSRSGHRLLRAKLKTRQPVFKHTEIGLMDGTIVSDFVPDHRHVCDCALERVPAQAKAYPEYLIPVSLDSDHVDELAKRQVENRVLLLR
jgi:hypothetical protein